MLICDTSGLLARYDPDDSHHEATAAAFERVSPPFVVSPLVLAEFEHLLRRHPLAAARAVLNDVLGPGFEHAQLDGGALRACLAVDERYADLNLGLADASVAVLAQRYRTRCLLTLDDRHFRAVTPLQGGAFQLLPLDE